MSDDNIKIELLSDSHLSANDNLINFKIIIVGESGVGKSSILNVLFKINLMKVIKQL